ncbi:PLC-like phosphodiesterase [Truncatella angustata]|uniref:PLC-like phosphodiesterase n=1 Tax=Truncatella angustata TaxID=152316 RepID=A0A9P8UPB7_9PEZI|nr:PLC-like phosphodiesterase [Truncatella angustata]KAH6655878.1 PLC-like phosphodiesterase [Truncatella angustata]
MRTFVSVANLAFATVASAINCNGNAALCDRKYSNVTFVGAHNSPFVGALPTQNQLSDVTAQLNKGIRFLTAQTHDKDGAVQLCHTECGLEDAGTLQSYLSTIKTWLDGNTNEVVTLLLTNGDAIDLSKFSDAFKASGLDTYTYAPTADLSLADWPTLGEIVASKKRLIVFMDYNADISKVSYILDEFKYYFETPFDPTDSQLLECNIDRPSGASANGRMYLVNHNLNAEVFGISIPDIGAASKTNSESSILAHSDICIGKYSRDPNVILLDYISLGNPIAAQNTLNEI